MIFIYNCTENTLLSFIIPILQTVISAAIVALCAWLFKDKLTKYIADTRRMKNYGIRSIYARDGKFTTKDLDTIFYKASKIKIFYSSGYRFWLQNIADGRIEKAKKINPQLEIQFILANPKSDYLKDVSAWEREAQNRPYNEKDLDLQIIEVMSLLNSYNDMIEIKVDDHLYFLPYMIVEFSDKHVVHWNLTIPPFRSHSSLKVIGERKTTSTKDNMTTYFETHFNYAWNNSMPASCVFNNDSCPK